MTAPGLLMLDRDGVLLNHVDPYILTLKDVSPRSGMDELFRAAARTGCPVAVVTNQSPISRGLVTWDFVRRVNDVIADRAAAQNHHRIRFHVCPHRAEDGCVCRKPQPGLLLRAAEAAGADPAASWMVGDHDTDMEAAHRANCGLAIHIGGGRQATPSRHADLHVDDLHQIARLLLAAAPTGDTAEGK